MPTTETATTMAASQGEGVDSRHARGGRGEEGYGGRGRPSDEIGAVPRRLHGTRTRRLRRNPLKSLAQTSPVVGFTTVPPPSPEWMVAGAPKLDG